MINFMLPNTVVTLTFLYFVDILLMIAMKETLVGPQITLYISKGVLGSDTKIIDFNSFYIQSMLAVRKYVMTMQLKWELGCKKFA